MYEQHLKILFWTTFATAIQYVSGNSGNSTGIPSSSKKIQTFSTTHIVKDKTFQYSSENEDNKCKLQQHKLQVFFLWLPTLLKENLTYWINHKYPTIPLFSHLNKLSSTYGIRIGSKIPLHPWGMTAASMDNKNGVSNCHLCTAGSVYNYNSFLMLSDVQKP